MQPQPQRHEPDPATAWAPPTAYVSRRLAAVLATAVSTSASAFATSEGISDRNARNSPA